MASEARSVALGDVVLYTIAKGRGAGQDRAAIVARVRDVDAVDLRVFDVGVEDAGAEFERPEPWHGLVSYARRGDTPGTWRPRRA